MEEFLMMKLILIFSSALPENGSFWAVFFYAVFKIAFVRPKTAGQ